MDLIVVHIYTALGKMISPFPCPFFQSGATQHHPDPTLACALVRESACLPQPPEQCTDRAAVTIRPFHPVTQPKTKVPQARGLQPGSAWQPASPARPWSNRRGATRPWTNTDGRNQWAPPPPTQEQRSTLLPQCGLKPLSPHDKGGVI
jgi:hypothetical protein